MKRLLSLLLTLTMLLSTLTLPVSATAAEQGIEPAAAGEELPRLYGDVNGDGAVDTNDAVSILRHAAKLDTLDETQATYADANADGEVDERDAVVILRHAAKFNELLGGYARITFLDAEGNTYALRQIKPGQALTDIPRLEGYEWKLSDGSTPDFSSITDNMTVYAVPLDASEGLIYRVSGTEATVTGLGTCADTVIVIPAEYEGKPVTAIGDRAFTAQTQITEVVIPDSVKRIGDSAFYRCTALTKVTLPDTVTTLDDSAFRGCTALTAFNIPAALTYLGDQALPAALAATTEYENGLYLGTDTNPYMILMDMKDTALTSFATHADTKFIYDNALSGATALATLELSDGLLGIGRSAFEDALSLTVMELPALLEYIGPYAFHNCAALGALSLPASLRSIGANAADGCSSLTSLHIPAGVSQIGDAITVHCPALTSLTVDPANTVYRSVNNCIVGITSGRLVAACKTSVIPQDGSVTAIGSFVFQSLPLTECTIPSGVRMLANGLFMDCTALSQVTLPASLTKIDKSAFRSCTALTAVYYAGTAEQWAQISIDASGNSALTAATVYCYSETRPTAEGDFWRYVDGVPTSWTIGYAVETDPDFYDSAYGYDYLGTLTKGEAMQTLYRRLDEQAEAFHSDTTLNAASLSYQGNVCRVLERVVYNDLGLTYEEARQTMQTWRKDNPMYYWLSSSWFYSGSVSLQLQVDPLYADGENRAYYNDIVYRGVEEFITAAGDESSEYLLTLCYHDAIVAAVNYAYEEDGTTPQDDHWAHRIIGVMTRQGVVCEGYAKTLQLLLNYSGVENMYVVGDAGGSHAWNLIRLDDGGWYWCDPTWNDAPNLVGGAKYHYFCVNDTQFIDWRDAQMHWSDNVTGEMGFVENHFPDGETAWDYIPLPERSATPFSSDTILELRETFSLDGMTFARIGYRTVQLVYADMVETLTVPETVTHDGVTYTVIAVGAMDANGLFSESLSIFDSLSEASEALAVGVEDEKTPPPAGVLSEEPVATFALTRGANNGVRKIVLPSTVTHLVGGAFRNLTTLETVVASEGLLSIGRSVFAGCTALSDLQLPDSLKEIYWQSFYACYSLTEFTVPSGVTFMEGANFNSCRYLKQVTLPESLTTLKQFLFLRCYALESVTIPGTVTEFENGLFNDCTALTDIHFGGTVEQWNQIVKPDNWNSSLTSCTVHCTNGDLSAS